MSVLQAIVLGIVQGLTEFIPISSTAHLVFASRAVGLYEGAEQTLRNEQTTATIAVIQLGTLVAVLAYFTRDIYNITIAFIRDHWLLLRHRRSEQTSAQNLNGHKPARISQEAWLGWLIILGSIPIATVGLAFKKVIEGPLTKNLWVIASMLIIVAILLLLAEKMSKRNRTMTELGMRDALAVGGAQVLALIPGASRSGSTIMAGLFVGQTRETAARFSFLLSIPAIGASGLLELREALEKLPEGSFLPLLISTVISGIVGYASIWFLLRFLRTHSTGIFIGYRLVLGSIILVLLTTGVLNPHYEVSSVPPGGVFDQPVAVSARKTANKSKDSVNFSRRSSRRSDPAGEAAER